VLKWVSWMIKGRSQLPTISKYTVRAIDKEAEISNAPVSFHQYFHPLTSPHIFYIEAIDIFPYMVTCYPIITRSSLRSGEGNYWLKNIINLLSPAALLQDITDALEILQIPLWIRFLSHALTNVC